MTLLILFLNTGDFLFTQVTPHSVPGGYPLKRKEGLSGVVVDYQVEGGLFEEEESCEEGDDGWEEQIEEYC